MPSGRGTSSLASLYLLLARRPWLVWGISLALHGLLLGAVYEFVWRPRAAHPQIEFARGDGSAEGSMVNDWSIIAQTPSLPASISAQVDHDPASDARTQHDITSDQSNEDAANFAGADLPHLADQEQKTPAVFGVASASQPTGVKLATKAPWGSNNQSNTGSSPVHSASGTRQSQGKQNAVGNPVAQTTGGSGPGIPTGAISRALPAPVYPEESRRRREQGVVKLEVEILPDGSVGQITVIGDPGYPRLVHAAIDSVRKAKRLPTWQQNGVAVKWVANIPFDFHLR